MRFKRGILVAMLASGTVLAMQDFHFRAYGPVKLKNGQAMRVCASALFAQPTLSPIRVQVGFFDVHTGKSLTPNVPDFPIKPGEGACVALVQGGQPGDNPGGIVHPSDIRVPIASAEAGIIAVIRASVGGVTPIDFRDLDLLVTAQVSDPVLGPGQLLPAVDLIGKLLPAVLPQ